MKLERVQGRTRCLVGAPIGFDMVQLVAYLVVGLVSANIGIALGRLVMG